MNVLKAPIVDCVVARGLGFENGASHTWRNPHENRNAADVVDLSLSGRGITPPSITAEELSDSALGYSPDSIHEDRTAAGHEADTAVR